MARYRLNLYRLRPAAAHTPSDKTTPAHDDEDETHRTDLVGPDATMATTRADVNGNNTRWPKDRRRRRGQRRGEGDGDEGDALAVGGTTVAVGGRGCIRVRRSPTWADWEGRVAAWGLMPAH